jgi:mannose/fructose/N-acetylgalactosamine-specific phosphotransferase system component IIC
VSLLTTGTAAGLVAWGTLAGMDLVSFPQALFSRPLIVGAGAGAIMGNPAVGLQIGLTMELFALDVLPVGASRYPDYGPGVVGAVVLAAGAPIRVTLGLGVLFSLGLAVLGGLSLQLLRTSNGAAIHQHAAGLAAGDPAAMAKVQFRGLASDLLRSLTLTVAAVGLAVLLRPLLPEGDRFALVSAVAIGCAVAAATSGAIRSAGRGARLRWLAAGAGLGLLLAVLR